MHQSKYPYQWLWIKVCYMCCCAISKRKFDNSLCMQNQFYTSVVDQAIQEIMEIFIWMCKYHMYAAWLIWMCRILQYDVVCHRPILRTCVHHARYNIWITLISVTHNRQREKLGILVCLWPSTKKISHGWFLPVALILVTHCSSH